MTPTPSQDRKLRGKLDGPNGDNEEQAREISGHQLQGTRMDPPQTGEEKMSDYDGGGFMGDGTKLMPALRQIHKMGSLQKRGAYSTFDIEDMGAAYQSRLNPPTQDQKSEPPTQDQKTNPPKLKASPEIVGRGENKQTGSPTNLPMSISTSDQDWFNPPARDLKHDSDVATRDTGLGSGDTDDNPISEVEPQEPQDARVRQAKGLDKRGMAELWLKSIEKTAGLFSRFPRVPSLMSTHVFAQALDNASMDLIMKDGAHVLDEAERAAMHGAMGKAALAGKVIPTSNPGVSLRKHGQEYLAEIDVGHKDIAGRTAPIVVHGPWTTGKTPEQIAAEATTHARMVPASHTVKLGSVSTKMANVLQKRADAVLEAGPEVFGREPKVSKFKMPLSLRKAGSLDDNPQGPTAPTPISPDIQPTNPVLEASYDVRGIRRVMNIVRKLEKGRIPI